MYEQRQCLVQRNFGCTYHGIRLLCPAGVIGSDEVEAAAQSSKGLASGHSHSARDALASAGADASHCIRTGWEASPWWMAKLRVRLVRCGAAVKPVVEGSQFACC